MKGKLTFVVMLVILLALVIRYKRPTEPVESSKFQAELRAGATEFQEKYNSIAENKDWQLFEEFMSDGG